MNSLQHHTLEQLTTEILIYKQQTAQNIIEIGRRLIHAKEVLPHGAWGKWLEERVEFSQEQARRLMRVANECSNSTAMLNLPSTKVFALLDVPTEEREQFIQEPHQLPTGETKTVDEMTTRELQETIRAWKAAEKAAAEAQAEKERLAEENKELRQANKELAKFQEPEVVEKQVEVIPPAIEKELARLRSEAKQLQEEKFQLNTQLKLKDMEEKDRIQKARLNKHALDQELTFFISTINTFLRDVARYTLLCDVFTGMHYKKAQEYDEALNRVEDWLRKMRQALPYDRSEAIEITYKEVEMNE